MANAGQHRAAFVKKMRSNGAPAGQQRRAGQRLAAYRAARGRGLAENTAARAAVREVPFTQNERRGGASFKGVRQRPNRKGKTKVATAARNRRTTANKRRATPNRRKRTATATPNRRTAKAAAKKPKEAAAKKPKKAAAKKPKRDREAEKSRREAKRGFGGIAEAAKAQKSAKARTARFSAFPKQYKEIQKKRTVKSRVAFGPYRRAKLVNPETGRSEYSYMYRRKDGRLSKIPVWAITGALSPSDMKQVLEGRAGTSAVRDAIRSHLDEITKKRSKAAERIYKKGGMFVPNRTAAQKRAGKRLAAFNAAKKRGMKVKEAAQAAVRAVPFTQAEKTAGKSFKGVSSAGAKTVASKKRSTKRRSTKRRSTKAKTKRPASAKGRKRTTKRRTTKKRAIRRIGSRRGVTIYASNRRGKKMKANRRRYRKNQFMSDLQRLLKTGSLIFGGFIAHRFLTGFACTLIPMPAMAVWQKPICGFGVLAGGIMGVNVLGKGMKPETKAAINGGMAVSFLQQLAVSVATAMGQTGMVSYLEGYSNSSAYNLRGMRGMRGMGALERHATSIMPQYAPVSGMGQFRQAAAGTGEYFASNAMGEYFANSGVQGVGSYEKAGPLALQPNRATGQIDDGIRPDSNLDDVLTLAESAAGLGQGIRQAAAGMGQFRQAAAGMRGMRGMGEFFAAAPSNGGFSEHRVPTQSQWIPSGPLWAGTMSAGDTPTESEIPAGILQGPGGNGILSGG